MRSYSFGLVIYGRSNVADKGFSREEECAGTAVIKKRGRTVLPDGLCAYIKCFKEHCIIRDNFYFLSSLDKKNSSPQITMFREYHSKDRGTTDITLIHYF